MEGDIPFGDKKDVKREFFWPRVRRGPTREAMGGPIAGDEAYLVLPRPRTVQVRREARSDSAGIFIDTIWVRRLGRGGIEVPIFLQQRQHPQRKGLVFAAGSLLPVLGERAPEKEVGEMEDIFGHGLERVSTDYDEVSRGHALGNEKT